MSELDRLTVVLKDAIQKRDDWFLSDVDNLECKIDDAYIGLVAGLLTPGRLGVYFYKVDNIFWVDDHELWNMIKNKTRQLLDERNEVMAAKILCLLTRGD